MELTVFLKLLKERQKTIWSFIVIFLIISLIFSFSQPLKYNSKSKLLVLQSASGTDPYTVSKSNEYLGNLFSQVVYSSSFFDLVTSSQFNIDKDYFTNNSAKQMKIWEKTVSAKSQGDTGIVSITVYHPDPYQVQQISLAINDVLMNKNFNYQGLGNLVKVNVIDQPIISNYPVKPNIILNTFLAIFGGLIFSLFYLYLLPEEIYAFYFFRRRNKKVKHLTAARDLKPTHVVQVVQAPSPNINDLINNQETNHEETEIKGDISNVLKQF
jgi:capsular polysaccharide biosynthesis protein